MFIPGLLAVVQTAWSAEFRWLPHWREGDHVNYVCEEPPGKQVANATFVVKSADAEGYDLEFTDWIGQAAIVHTDSAGVPHSVANAEALLQEWREPREDEARSVGTESFLAMLPTTTAEVIEQFVIARAARFLPLGVGPWGEEPRELTSPLVHPLQYGGVPARGDLRLSKRTRAGATIVTDLTTDHDATWLLTFGTIVAANAPDADFRPTFVFLIGLSADEHRMSLVSRRDGWPESVEIQRTLSNDGFADPVVTARLCVRGNGHPDGQ